MTDADSGAERRIAEMLRGHVVTQIIATAVHLGVLERLNEAAGTPVERLATETGTSAVQLRRLLRALDELGLVAQAGDDIYTSMPLARPLHPANGRLYGHALMSGADYYESWSRLDHSVRTGESAFVHRHARTLWERLEEDPEVAESFIRTMGWNTTSDFTEISASLDVGQAKVVADLGAGEGTLTIGLLRAYPHLEAIVSELPAVLPYAKRRIEAERLDSRCQFVTGSLLDAVPGGADVYFLKSVVHNWTDDAALRILRNCRDVIGAGRLVIVERALAPTAPNAGVRDLTMLVLFGSHDRTTEEYSALLVQAGFEVVAVACTPSHLCIMEAVKS